MAIFRGCAIPLKPGSTAQAGILCILACGIVLAVCLESRAGEVAGNELDRAAELFDKGYQYQTGEGVPVDLKRALSFYRKARQIYPQGYPPPFALLYNTGLIYAAKGQNRNAQAFFVKAARGAQQLAKLRSGAAAQKVARQSEALARNGLGSCYQHDGKMAAAEQQYRIAIQRYPQLVEAHFNLVNVLSEQQRWDEMEKALKRAEKLAPSPRYEIFRGRRGGHSGQTGTKAYGGAFGITLILAVLMAYYLFVRMRRH